jgi:uncharacterized protein with von Willebrand factor type A (vWA) domain
MIDALCGFAAVVRNHGGDVGSAELIDAARAFRLIDLADRSAVCTALTLTIAWSAEQPELFQQLLDDWFDGGDLDLRADETSGRSDLDTISLDADTVDAARIHTDDAVAIDTPEPADDATRSPHDSPTAPTRSPSRPGVEGADEVGAVGDLAPMPPRDHAGDAASGAEVVLELPMEPPDADLELARSALAAAVQRRRLAAARHGAVIRPVTAFTVSLSTGERARIGRVVQQFDRQLDGAPSWRRTHAQGGTIDLRRTLRRSVTTGGLPIDLRRVDRRGDAARLVVLVDLSVSVRGTARLVLHLVHRLRTMRGVVRAFGFVDECVAIDRALRFADPVIAIEHVLGLVDVDAASDPGAALRQWWSRSHHLVTPVTHVLILGDGRCNGNDPAFEVIDRLTRRSASTTWITPEPRGAWRLGRGEMEQYAMRVDRAITVRSLDDLEQLTATPITRLGRQDLAALGRTR